MHVNDPAFIALVLYDHICTIPQEMQLIWGSKVTSTMVLFHANRWLILAYTILNIVDMFLHPGTIVVSALILPELAPIDAGRPRGQIPIHHENPDLNHASDLRFSAVRC